MRSWPGDWRLYGSEELRLNGSAAQVDASFRALRPPAWRR
ncbi:hypothetical protein HNR67_006068 [Crossiella cryophila]|uniref:Uncharacterized protein n=1 Tax=Crossiella cryophila TaxID=43355 RepID=A0A7W7CF44_9PSEU|nr:hypothetical protein [Crossiella cryophila]